MPSQISADVATEVRSVVAKLGVKHVAIAAHLGLSPMALSRRMRGTVSFTAEEIYALAEFLGVDVGELYPGVRPAPTRDARGSKDSSDPASPDSPMKAIQFGSDVHPSPPVSAQVAAPYALVEPAGETADIQGSAGQPGRARDQLAADSTRAFPAIVERPE